MLSSSPRSPSQEDNIGSNMNAHYRSTSQSSSSINSHVPPARTLSQRNNNNPSSHPIRNNSGSNSNKSRLPLVKYILIMAVLVWVYSAYANFQFIKGSSVFHPGLDSFVDLPRNFIKEPKGADVFDVDITEEQEAIPDNIQHVFLYTCNNDGKGNSKLTQMKEMITDHHHHSIASKQQPKQRLEKIHTISPEEQRSFLSQYGDQCYHQPSSNLKPKSKSSLLLDKYDASSPMKKSSLWKYCSAFVNGGIYINVDNVTLLQSIADLFPPTNIKKKNQHIGANYAIFNPEKQLLIDFVIAMNQPRNAILKKILELLYMDGNNTEDNHVEHQIYKLLQSQQQKQHNNKKKRGTEWTLLEQRCTCTSVQELCCHVIHPDSQDVIMLTTQLTSATAYVSPKLDYSSPTTAGEKNAASTISSMQHNAAIITVETHPLPTTTSVQTSPNFSEIMSDNDCLPTNTHCKTCLSSHKGNGCKSPKCLELCPCYCNALCSIKPLEKRISKTFWLAPPRSSGRNRMIPRIIHQIWHEPLTKKKYPQLSRVVESWKQSDWEYRYYSPEDVDEFLSTHFPPEVKDVYDALIPIRFKNDLARYCLLLIHGGVFADIDVMLNVNLDNALDDDVGFMSVLDDTGKDSNHQMCLWNSLVASAPAHPFLASVVQIIVNNVRNRFTSVDYDTLMCPSPPVSLIYNHANYFTTGPCVLGAAVNKVLGREMSHSFEIGDSLIPESQGDDYAEMTHSSSAAVDWEEDDNTGYYTTTHSGERIPGRSILLKPKYNDMGAMRFTMVEKTVIVATTIRKKLEQQPSGMKYPNVPYGKKIKKGVYGQKDVYINNEVANEEIRLVVGEQPL